MSDIRPVDAPIGAARGYSSLCQSYDGQGARCADTGSADAAHRVDAGDVSGCLPGAVALGCVCGSADREGTGISD